MFSGGREMGNGSNLRTSSLTTFRCLNIAVVISLLFPALQHSHSFPFAFSKASLPSDTEKYASPAAPMASA